STQIELEYHQTANTHSALNDLVRLTNEILEGVSGGSEKEVLASISASVDILFVRADHLQTRLKDLKGLFLRDPDYVSAATMLQSGADAVTAIQLLVEDADTAMSSEDPIAVFATPELVERAKSARRAVFRYLDETDKLEVRMFARQSREVVRLSRAVYVFLGLITLAGLACLRLLRGEVMARKARDKAERRADHLAYFDPVTGLANRVQFQDRVDDFLAPGAKGALILIDLDGFKDINDRHGHVVGDNVLKYVGRCIRAEAEANLGIAARLGGDEFAVFLESDSTAFLKTFCMSLISECSRPFQFGDERVSPGISVGLATTTQLSAIDTPRFEDLMRVSDFALYASKSAGRGRYTLYDSELERAFKERRRLMKDLPRAILQGELEVYLQPKVDLQSGRVKGFEALVRWKRDGEILPPADFIQIAEESGRIVDIDRFVLDTAVEIIAAWNRRYSTDFSVSVNLSGLHFRRAQSLSFVHDALLRHGLPPELLTLEITETVQLANWEQVGESVAELRDRGCRISIDDFGTGYSSLAYLRTISADELKIDKSLIAEIETSGESQFILDAVLDLARSLGLEVVVEGVERPEQREILCKLGCTNGQGFLFDRPKPAENALAGATFSKDQSPIKASTA
ncbi:MAG: putative bifunctional diguanylate cyclase/phosphodiesterase, partial [Boseongicola sp.]